jgi:hypothetical protein
MGDFSAGAEKMTDLLSVSVWPQKIPTGLFRRSTENDSKSVLCCHSHSSRGNVPFENYFFFNNLFMFSPTLRRRGWDPWQRRSMAKKISLLGMNFLNLC